MAGAGLGTEIPNPPALFCLHRLCQGSMERDRELRDSSAGLSTPAIGSSAALLPDPTHWIICLCAPLAP